MLTSNEGAGSTAEPADQLDPQDFINLISILDAYLTDEVSGIKPYLVKESIKIIL